MIAQEFTKIVCCCSWILTWFSHQSKTQEVLELWDFLIASEPSMILYLCAAIVITEWEDKSMESDDMMENIQLLKNLDFVGKV